MCLKVLQVRPRQIEALILLGIIAAQTGDLENAVALFGQALQVEPRNVAALNNQANALRALGRFEAAIASYDRAIALDPKHAPTHNSRGKALLGLRRYEDSIAGNDRALALNPAYAPAHLDRGRALAEMSRHEAAIGSLDQALALEPGQPGAWYIRANALYALGRFEAALASYDRAIALKPDDARAHHNRGNALIMLERPESAIESYEQAIALDPHLGASHAERLHARMQIADWRDFAPELARLKARIARDEAAANPFILLSLCGSATLQRQAANSWVREQCPPNGMLGVICNRSRRHTIRVGYFSAEFHDHATSYLTAELYELHDRSRIELTAFSLGRTVKDGMRKRLEAAFERFLDVGGESDHEIARLARSLEIDIAVDLGGFTRGGRPGIFALRAAPIQVSYLGYLGTLSADYMDYLIADETIVPQAHRDYYREKIAYLPSYQVNDSKRRVAGKRLERAELGLPAAGFVFCCFNATYKITPETFDSWMRILRRTPGSVLLLLGGRESLESNLRREARAREVAEDRIIFGGRLPAPEYLARYRTADLFLDTSPYNAGTTASDALWAGLPVLTCLGESFAGRVGASLLTAVGLPELIATTRGQYEELAVELASDPRRMAALRARLAGDLRTRSLFDTTAFARHLEAAYARMYDRYHAGLAPEHLRVDP